MTGEFEEGAGWRVRIGSGIPQPSLVSGPALDSEGRVVVVGSEDGNVYAFDAVTGEEKWKLPNPTGGKVWSTPLVHDQTVYFGSHGQARIRRLPGERKPEMGYPHRRSDLGAPPVLPKPGDRRVLRQETVCPRVDFGPPAMGCDRGQLVLGRTVTDGSSIFAPSMDGNVYAIDRDGNLLWKHDMGSPIVSRPVLVSQGLMVAGKDGKISLLDTDVSVAAGQREVAFTNIHGDAEVTAPLFAVGNSVFVGSQDSTVTRIEVRTNQAGQASVRTHWCLDTRHGDVQCETAGE